MAKAFAALEVTYLKPDSDGLYSVEAIEGALRPNTVLVSIMHANNEVGAVLPLAAVGALCRSRGVLLHVDACQSLTKVSLHAHQMQLDLVSLNAHKLHGPKGVGALYVRQEVLIILGTSQNSLLQIRGRLSPQQLGGGHESGLRSGTLNVPGIVGFARAVEIAISASGVEHMQTLQARVLDALKPLGDRLVLNGPAVGPHRLCSVLNVQLAGVEGDALVRFLGRHGVHAAMGSACSTQGQVHEPSHVLIAIGRTPKQAKSALRLSFSRDTRADEVDRAAALILQYSLEHK